MECSESAFLYKGALFVYFCKTGGLLGYKNSGQGGYFGYKDKEFNTGKSIRFKKGLTVKGNPFFILIFMLDIASDALNFAKYIVKTATSLFRGLCRRSVLKEWERSAKEQSAAIFILSKDRGRAMRTKRFVCFFIKHRKTVDRMK